MLLQQDVCRVHMSSLKPTLTDENKVSRMELALSFINKNDTSKFEHMEDLIHINKKWFYLMKDGQHFIIAADEAEPYRHVQHKSFLTKIMFLCVVARPRYDTNKNAFSRAIQSFNDDCPANEEELIKSVEKAYGEYPMLAELLQHDY